MARPEHLYVFCYDISRDKVRGRVADALEAVLVRVQGSVYEGRLTRDAARRLADQTGAMIETGDSLRVYAVTQAGLKASIVKGPQPLMQAEGYYLL